jgi:hypothetical protein
MPVTGAWSSVAAALDDEPAVALAEFPMPRLARHRPDDLSVPVPRRPQRVAARAGPELRLVVAPGPYGMGAVITWPERIGRDDARACSLQLPVTPPEEVRPMNAVSMWVLPLPVTVGRLT